MPRITVSAAQRAELDALDRLAREIEVRKAAYCSAIAHGAGHTAPLLFQGVEEPVPGQLLAVFAEVEA
jgi:hypothetical protein